MPEHGGEAGAKGGILGEVPWRGLVDVFVAAPDDLPYLDEGEAVLQLVEQDPDSAGKAITQGAEFAVLGLEGRGKRVRRQAPVEIAFDHGGRAADEVPQVIGQV